MASLTVTAFYSRKIIKWGSVGLVAFMVLRSVVLGGIAYWKRLHPPPAAPPTVAFGKLPKPYFVETAKPNNGYTYRLETISGQLPKASDRANVYFMPKATANYLAWERTKTWATKVGFSKEPTQVDEYNYRFSTGTFPETTMDINVLTRNFHLTYDWKNGVEILKGNPPQQETAISLAKGYLASAGVLNDELKKGRAEVSYYRYANGQLELVPYANDASFAKVNLFRADIEENKVIPDQPKMANVWVMLSPLSGAKSVIEVEYTHNQASFDKTATSTYPIKTPDAAWKELSSGGGFITDNAGTENGQIIIRNVYLAYYDSKKPQNFLQPIYVFENEKGFAVYVTAIADSWYE